MKEGGRERGRESGREKGRWKVGKRQERGGREKKGKVSVFSLVCN